MVKSTTEIYLSGNLDERRQEAARQLSQVQFISPFALFKLGLFRSSELDGKNMISCVDLIAVFTETENEPRKKWDQVKRSLKRAKSNLSQKVRQLPLPGEDGKSYPTDVLSEIDAMRLLWKLNTPLAERFTELCAEYLYGIARGTSGGDVRKVEELYKTPEYIAIEAKRRIGK